MSDCEWSQDWQFKTIMLWAWFTKFSLHFLAAMYLLSRKAATVLLVVV